MMWAGDRCRTAVWERTLVKYRAKLFTVVLSGRMRDKEHNFKEERSSLNTKKNFLSSKAVKCEKKLPREAIQSPS